MSAVVHWYFGWPLCEEHAMGDDVIDETNGDRADVNCQECLEWLHA